MQSLTTVRIIQFVLESLGVRRSETQIRGAVSDYDATESPVRVLSGCLIRLGVRTRRVAMTLEDALKSTDHRSGFLYLCKPTDRNAAFAMLDGKIHCIGRDDAASPALTDTESVQSSLGLGPRDSVELLSFEPHANLDSAREDAEGSHELSPFRRLMGLFAPDARDIAVVILFAVGVGILSLATPIAVQSLVNFVAFGGLVQPLFVIGILLFAFLAMAGAIGAYKSYIVEVLQRRLFVRVVGDLAHRLPRVRLDAFDSRSGPELVNRFFDVFTVQKASATFLLDGVGVLLQALIGLIILAFYHPFLLAFDIVLIAAILFVVFVLGRGAVRTAIRESKTKYAVAASLEEIALNPLLFKQAGGGDYAWRRTDALAADYVDARRRHFRVVLRQIVGAVTLQAIAATTLLTLGGFLVIQGELTLGQLVAAELIVSVVLASFAKFGKHLESIYDLLAGVDKLGQLIDLPLERQGGEEIPVRTGPGAVRLIEVGFDYGGTGAMIENINLDVEPGERLLIVGDHGTGKSTLCELICGVRTATQGRVELDGVDLREMSLDAIRRHIAIVKGIEVVEGSISENIRLDRSDITHQQVRDAVRAVGLLDDIRELPYGFETQLNHLGRPLSYGQACRLMVARAIAGNPRVLVLDNLLDDFDASARADVVHAILSPDRPWTVILTSQTAHQINELTRSVALESDRTLVRAP
ncbi:MAG: ATP-binding cassette domain-containing protein [Phycisphaerales bacterium]|nr:ATP-binding cassette domain-containing protein [Phycisphaerales bacterium]